MRRVGWLSIAALGTACHADVVAYYELPVRGPDDRSLLVVSEHPDRVEAQAFSLSPARSLTLDLPPDATAIALFYSKSPLPELGAAEGQLEAAGAEVCGARSLPGDARTYEATVPGGELGFEASTLERLSPAIRSFHYRGPCPCLDLHIEESFEVLGRYVNAAVAFDNGWLFAGSDVYGSVDLDRGLEIWGPSDNLIHGMWTAPDGQLYFGTKDGRILTGDLRRGLASLTVVATSSPASTIERFDGSDVPGAPLEIVWSDSAGGFFRYADGMSTTVRPSTLNTTNQLEDALWLGPGKAMAIQAHAEGITYFDASDPRSTVRIEEWPLILGPPMRLFQTEAFGVMLSTRAGDLWQKRGDLWDLVPFPSEDDRSNVVSLAEYDHGFVELRQEGRVIQYHPSLDGYCPRLELPPPQEGKKIVRHGDHFLVIGILPEVSFLAGEPNRIYVLATQR